MQFRLYFRQHELHFKLTKCLKYPINPKWTQTARGSASVCVLACVQLGVSRCDFSPCFWRMTSVYFTSQLTDVLGLQTIVLLQFGCQMPLCALGVAGRNCHQPCFVIMIGAFCKRIWGYYDVFIKSHGICITKLFVQCVCRLR